MVHQHNRQTRSRRVCGAFTLIELLVVISVVALLMALLLPALTAARDSSQTTRCAINMRSFITGLSLYLQDSAEMWPNRESTGKGDAGAFAGKLFAYGHISDPSILICPTSPPNVQFMYFNYIRQPYNRNDVVFNNIYKGITGYNLPFGTYYWMGGGFVGNNPAGSFYIYFQTMAGSLQFVQRSSHVGDPARFSPIWDWDLFRSGATDRDMSPHSFQPGRTSAYFDGHVRFLPNSAPENANCTQTSFLKGAEHLTPIYNHYQVAYSGDNYSVHGYRYNAAVAMNPSSNPSPAGMTRGILTIPFR